MKENAINRYQLSLRRLQKEEALKARVVKANETGEKEKVLSPPLLFVLLVIQFKIKQHSSVCSSAVSIEILSYYLLCTGIG